MGDFFVVVVPFLPVVQILQMIFLLCHPAATDKIAGLLRSTWNGAFYARLAPHRGSSIILFMTEISAGLMARLQMGQNAAARLLTSYSTMTRVNARHLLFTLHWLCITAPFKAPCFHLQEALARSAARTFAGTASPSGWCEMPRERRSGGLPC